MSAHPPSAQAAASSPSASNATVEVALPFRWSHLYSDALHSILQFTSLTELSRVLRVSRRWSDAVTTMPSIQAASDLGGAIDNLHDPNDLDCRSLLAARMQSPLARHVASLGDAYFESIADLQQVAGSMPWLRELWIRPRTKSISPKRWPAAIAQFASLCLLSADLADSGWGRPATNLFLAAIGTRTALETLTIDLPTSFGVAFSFAPLSALRSLRDFTIRARNTLADELSDAQIDELRAMTSVHTFSSWWTDGEAGSDFLARMLRPGHALQWTTVSKWMELREPLASRISSLSGLMELRATLHCPNVHCFSQLLHLTDVSLSVAPGVPLDVGALIASLSHCSAVRSLKLDTIDLSSEHFATLLPSFPQLATLELDDLPCVSLRFLDTPALAASLKTVYLCGLRACPAAELVHLLQLRALASLSIYALATPANDEQRAYFAIPSARFPHLYKAEGLDPPEEQASSESDAEEEDADAEEEFESESE